MKIIMLLYIVILFVVVAMLDSAAGLYPGVWRKDQLPLLKDIVYAMKDIHANLEAEYNFE